MMHVINPYRYGNPLIEGLTHYWPISANSNDLIGGINGTDTSISYVNASDFQNSASFTASTSAQINFGDNLGFTFSSDFTLTCRFNLVATGTSFLVSKRGAATDLEFQLAFVTGGASLRMRMFDQSTGGTRDISYALSPSTATWYEITITYINNTLKFYVNGVDTLATQVDTGSFVAVEDGTANLLLGKYSASTANSLNGYMGEVAIWNKGLTPDLVALIKSKHDLGLRINE